MANAVPDQSIDEDTAWSFTVPAGTFSDIDGDALTYGATLGNGDALPAWLDFDAATRVFTGTPPANFNGSLDLKVTASDGALTASDTFTLTVNPVNDAPVNGVPGLQSVSEDGSRTFGTANGNALSVSDVDVGSGSLEVTLSVAHGALTLSGIAGLSFTIGDGTGDATMTFSGTAADINAALEGLVYAPAANYHGGDTLNISTTDLGGSGSGGVKTDSDTVAITVTSVNDAPVVANTITDQSVDEDTAWSFTVPAGTFSDIDGDALTYGATLGNGDALPAWLDFDAATRVFTGTPPLNFNGSLDLKVTASDGALTASDTFTLTVNPVNDAPVAVTDSYATNQDTMLVVALAAGVLANDTDVENDALTAVLVTGPSHGTLTLDAHGSFSYTPEANYHGSDSFTYKANDSGADSAPVTVSLTINPVNDAPEGADNTIAIAKDTAHTFTAADFGYSDVDGDAFAGVRITTVPADGTLQLDGVDVTAGQTIAAADLGGLVFTPAANANGAGYASFTFEVSDGAVYDPTPNTLTIDVTPVNDAPMVTITPLASAPVGDEFRINTATTGNQYIPVIAGLADGGFVVTWQSSDGDGLGIYAQRYDAGGAAQGGEFLVNTYTTNQQEQPAVAALDDGGFVVTWQSNGQDGSGYGVYAQRYAENGAVVGGEFRVNTTMTSDPTVGALAGGGYIIAWEGLGPGDDDGIFAQRYAENGAAVGGAFRVNTTTARSQTQAAIAGLADGGFVVTWMSFNQDGDGYGIYAQRYDASGASIGGEFLVNTATTGSQYIPVIAGLADGGFVVTWQSRDGDGLGVYAQRYDAGGAAQGGEFRVNTETANDQAQTAIAALDDGGFVITWISDLQDGSGYGVYAQRYAENGAAVGGEFLVNTETAGNQTRAAIAALDDGGFVVTWTSVGQDGSSAGIYAQRYDNAFQAVEQTDLDIKGTIAVSDADAGAGEITVTLSADYGVLAVTAGTSGAEVLDSGTDTVTITGTLAQIRALLRDDATSTVVYIPDTDAPPASAALTVTVDDGGNSGAGGPLTAVATMTIYITPVNDAPIAPASRSVTTNEDVATGLIAIGASDVDGDTLAYSVKPGFAPAKGSVTFSNGMFRYTPGLDANGADSFTILIEDGNGGFAEQVVSITINPVDDTPPPPPTTNSAPVAGDDSVSATEDRSSTYSFASLLANDRDPDGDFLTITNAFNASNGSVRISGEQIIFMPRADFFGLAGFSYIVSDGNGGTDTAHVAIQVAGVNDAPVLPAIAPLTTPAGMGIVFSAQASDADLDPLTYAASAPVNGKVTVEAGGRIVYTPNAGFTGHDSFTLDVADGKGGVASRTVEVSVVPIEDQPDWRLFTREGFAGEISGGGVVFGTNGFDDITVLDGPGMTVFDASFNRGGDVIRLDGAADGWRVALTGSNALFSDGDSFVLVPIGVEGIAVVFDDGPRTLRFDAAGDAALIGSQTIGSALEPIAAPFSGQVSDQADPEATGLLLTAVNATVTVGDNLTVVGTNGAETVHVMHGDVMFDGSFNRGGDTIAVDEAAGAFTVSRSGSLVLFDSEHTDLAIPMGTAGTTIAFANGERKLRYDPELDMVLIGTQQIGLSPAAITDFA